MKNKLFLLLLLFFIVNVSFGQSGIRALRYMDNNAVIKADTSDRKFYRAVKEIEFNKKNQSSFTFGGDFRLRIYQKFNPTYTTGEASQHYFWERFLLHADLKINNSLRVFTQFGSMHMQGRSYIIPEIDNDRLDLMQGFVNVKFKLGADLTLRVGRQELLYGTDRFLGMRDGPNVRQSYDAVKLIVNMDKLSGDFLVFKPVVNQDGLFDNVWNENELHYGTYWTYTNEKLTDFNVYYFISERDTAQYIFKGNVAEESRHSIGLRMSQTQNPFFHDTEINFQFGKFGNNNISAFQQLTRIGYQFKEVKLKPLIQLQEFIASGDTKANDGKINTFRTISSRPATDRIFYYGSMNAITLMPEAMVNPTNKLILMLRYIYTRRYSVNDVLYTPDNASSYFKGTASDGKNGKPVVQGTEFDVSYTPNKHIKIDTMFSLFVPDDFLKQNGAEENLKALFLSLTYKF